MNPPRGLFRGAVGGHKPASQYKTVFQGKGTKSHPSRVTRLVKGRNGESGWFQRPLPLVVAGMHS